MSNFDDLFNDDALDAKLSFLEEKKSSGGADGLYRVDLSKVTDKKRGYRATLRLLPNMSKEGKIGPAAIEKISHYVKIQGNKVLSGYYDSPKSVNAETGQPFADKCPLTDTYWTMQNSKNQLLIERSKEVLNYSRKYYSYVLVLEDEQQPELVGKIMVFQYGNTVKNQINSEKNGDYDDPCNVFKLNSGKDFQLIVREVQDEKGNTLPDYKSCQFKRSSSSISLPSNGEMKNLPLDENGQIPENMREKVFNFLMSRDVNIEDFSPKPLTEEQVNKVEQIIAYLTGANTATQTNETVDAEDFFMEEENTSSSNSSSEETSNSDEFDFDF